MFLVLSEKKKDTKFEMEKTMFRFYERRCKYLDYRFEFFQTQILTILRNLSCVLLLFMNTIFFFF